VRQMVKDLTGHHRRGPIPGASAARKEARQIRRLNEIQRA
jgi:hypothetical protein